MTWNGLAINGVALDGVAMNGDMNRETARNHEVGRGGTVIGDE